MFNLHKPKANLGQTPINAKRQLEDKILAFVFRHLALWRDAHINAELNECEKLKECNENKLNECLVRFLVVSARSNELFTFLHQVGQSGRCSVDIAAINANTYSDENILVFEAKRLPAPSPRREKEYLQGEGGAVERFKRERHGADHNRASIIAYIQRNNPEYFHKTINQWIIDLSQDNSNDIIWNKTECLNFQEKCTQQSVFKLSSIHPRLELKDIELDHLWVVL